MNSMTMSGPMLQMDSFIFIYKPSLFSTNMVQQVLSSPWNHLLCNCSGKKIGREPVGV